MTRRIRWPLAVLCLALGLNGPGQASATAWTPPRLARVVSGPSRPLVYAWGLAYNPVKDEVWAGDYLNYQIRRFSRGGDYLGNFFQPRALAGGIPYGIAIDPRDGSVYVAQSGGGAGKDIAKYSSDGVFIWDFDWSGNVGYLAVDPQGFLYINEVFGTAFRTFKVAVDDTNHTATEVLRFGTSGQGPGLSRHITGVAVAADGRVFTADTSQSIVHSYAPDGTWLRDIGQRGSGPGQFKGDMRGLSVDDNAGLLYVADSQEGQIEVFTLDGAPVRTFGALGTAPGQFSDGAREIAVTPDGHLWAADYGDSRLEEFRADGTWVRAAPQQPAEADAAGTSQPRDVAVDPATGDILVADPWNQRYQRFSSDGTLIGVWGRRGSFPPYGANYPRSVGVDPASGNVWLVNYENAPFTEIYARDGSYVSDLTLDRFFIDVDFFAGRAYLANFFSRKVEIRDVATGTVVGACCSGERLQGVAVDQATGNVYTANADRNFVTAYRPDGTILRTLTVDQTPYGITIAGDVVYVTDVGANEVIAFDRLSGARLGTFGQTGSGPGQFKSPSGLDHDAAGNLYIADTGNSRVQVFSFDARPSAEATPPTISFAAPAGGSIVSDIPTVVTGTASDASGVATVAVAIKDTTTGQWWDGRNSTWGAAQVWNGAALSGPINNPNWRFSVIGAQLGHALALQAEATDMVGNVSGRPRLSFTTGDLAPPDTTITAPVPGSVSLGIVSLGGGSTDDLAVVGVDVSVTDDTTRNQWDPVGRAWSPDNVWYPAALTTPGTRSSSWSAVFDGGQPGGRYSLRARASDSAGKQDPTPVTEMVTMASSDTVAPETAVSAPGLDTVVSSGLIVGTATDNVGVDGVTVAIQDRVSKAWWNAANATFGPITWNPASLVTPGASTTVWTFNGALPSGSYMTQVRAVDSSANIDPTPAVTRFTVSSDTVAPETTLTTPTPDQDLGPAASIVGQATDDVGVARVQVSLRDKVSGLYWQAATSTWVAGFRWNDASLDTPGAAATGWTLPAPSSSARYYVSARATDTSGTVDASPAAASFSVDLAEPGYGSVERWDGVAGTALTDIPIGAPSSASMAVDLTKVGLTFHPSGVDAGYRVRVILQPTLTDDYRFWLASDDNGALLLNRNGTDPAGAQVIATVPGFTTFQQWAKYPQQRSALIHLVAGQQYYLEYDVKQGTGDVHGSVAWQGNLSAGRTVVPPAALHPAGQRGAGGWRPGTHA